MSQAAIRSTSRRSILTGTVAAIATGGVAPAIALATPVPSEVERLFREFQRLQSLSAQCEGWGREAVVLIEAEDVVFRQLIATRCETHRDLTIKARLVRDLVATDTSGVAVSDDADWLEKGAFSLVEDLLSMKVAA